MGWADWIFAIEKQHAERIRSRFPEQARGKRIVTLFIKDIYQAMEPALISVFEQKLARYIEIPSERR